MLEPGEGDGPDALGFVVLGQADPYEPVVAVFDDNLANPFQVLGFGGGAEHRLAAVPQSAQRAV